MKRFVVPKPFAPLLSSNGQIIIEKSGRSTGKSTTNETVAIKLMLESKYNNILYMRAEGRDLRDIFNSTLGTIQSLGVEEHFTYKVSPFEMRCNKTGAKMYFRAVNGKTAEDLTATKGFVPLPNRTLAMAILDEANEVKCYNHVVAAETTVNKFLLPYGKIVYAYNPPPSKKHWANHEFPKMWKEQRATLITSTWEDIRKLLKSATIQSIENTRKNDPVHYKFWYEGDINNLEGCVIWSFDRNKHLLPLSVLQKKIGSNLLYQPVEMFYGIDSGITSDATAVSAWGVYPDGKLIKLNTMYLNIKEERRKSGLKGVSHTTQVALMYEWYTKYREKMRAYGIIVPESDSEHWCFDGAALTQDLMLEWRKATGFSSVAVTNKDVERDNARLVNSYHSNMLFILDIPENQVSVEEMETFCYDENNEIPEGQSDHTIDADKYATYEYYYNFI